MWVMLLVGGFVFFADPLEEAGVDWRGAIYSASVWITGGEE